MDGVDDRGYPEMDSLTEPDPSELDPAEPDDPLTADGEGGKGFPAMAPLQEPMPAPQDTTWGTHRPGQDHLLPVTGVADARTALDAAEALVIVEGRATAWSALSQLAYVSAFLSIFVVDPGSVPFAVTLLVFGGLLALSQLCLRVGGVQPKRPRARVVVAGLVVILTVAVASIGFNLPESWFLGFLALCAAGAVVTPIVQWFRSGRRSSVRGWGSGTQAFAVLSLLDGAGAFTPGHLGSRAGLDPETGSVWIERLRAEHLIMGGQARRRPLGRDWVAITDTGRERLVRMRTELEDQAAADVPVS